MGHTLIRNRKTGAVWPCPDRALESALSNDNPFLGSSWVKAAKDAEPSIEQPATAGRSASTATSKEN